MFYILYTFLAVLVACQNCPKPHDPARGHYNVYKEGEMCYYGIKAEYGAQTFTEALLGCAGMTFQRKEYSAWLMGTESLLETGEILCQLRNQDTPAAQDELFFSGFINDANNWHFATVDGQDILVEAGLPKLKKDLAEYCLRASAQEWKEDPLYWDKARPQFYSLAACPQEPPDYQYETTRGRACVMLRLRFGGSMCFELTDCTIQQEEKRGYVCALNTSLPANVCPPSTPGMKQAAFDNTCLHFPLRLNVGASWLEGACEAAENNVHAEQRVLVPTGVRDLRQLGLMLLMAERMGHRDDTKHFSLSLLTYSQRTGWIAPLDMWNAEDYLFNQMRGKALTNSTEATAFTPVFTPETYDTCYAFEVNNTNYTGGALSWAFVPIVCGEKADKKLLHVYESSPANHELIHNRTRDFYTHNATFDLLNCTFQRDGSQLSPAHSVSKNMPGEKTSKNAVIGIMATLLALCCLVMAYLLVTHLRRSHPNTIPIRMSTIQDDRYSTSSGSVSASSQDSTDDSQTGLACIN